MGPLMFQNGVFGISVYMQGISMIAISILTQIDKAGMEPFMKRIPLYVVGGPAHSVS